MVINLDEHCWKAKLMSNGSDKFVAIDDDGQCVRFSGVARNRRIWLSPEILQMLDRRASNSASSVQIVDAIV